MSKIDGTDGPAKSIRVFDAEVDGETFTFNVTMSHFNRFVRDSQRDVGLASSNLLLATCTERDRLLAAFEADWSLPLQLVEPIQAALVPVRQVTVKKR